MSGAVFVVAGPTTAPQGPVASMVSTAGWARGAERVLGSAWIVTPAGVIAAADALALGTNASLTTPSRMTARRLVPGTMKTLLKDVRGAYRARHFIVDADRWRDDPPRFVWQRHGLFHTAGIDLARTLGVPSVLFVPATLVWEATQWGTRRPGWASYTERFGERPALTGADVVACGTAVVAEQALRLGVDPGRVIITPTGVDLERFTGDFDREATRRELGVTGRFVVGWVGSFRRFHALERAVEAAAELDDACLLLVGDGPERSRIEALAAQRGVEVRTTGTVMHDRLPQILAAMDVAVVLARGDQAFHYSPLKVAEYLAAGLPVVAPDVGQLSKRLHDGQDCLLVAQDDEAALVAALCRIRDDPAVASRLRRGARESAVRRWSWDHQVERVLSAIEDLPPSAKR